MNICAFHPLHPPPPCPPRSASRMIWQQWVLTKASRSSHSAVKLLSSSDPQIMEMRGWLYSTKIPYRDSFSLFLVRERSKGNWLISIPKETKTPRALCLLQSNNKHPKYKKDYLIMTQGIESLWNSSLSKKIFLEEKISIIIQNNAYMLGGSPVPGIETDRTILPKNGGVVAFIWKIQKAYKRFPIPSQVNSWLFHIPKNQTQNSWLKISIPFTQTICPAKGLSSTPKKFATLWSPYSSLAFSGLETPVVFANMGFFQGRKIKQLFNYIQVTLGNKHRNPPGQWIEKKNQTLTPLVLVIKLWHFSSNRKGKGTITMRLEFNSHSGLIKLWAWAHVNHIGQHCACGQALLPHEKLLYI